MAYSPTSWINGTTKLGATNLNHLETGVANALDKSDMTAKGDLLVATASGTYARLAVGSDNTVFVADSAQSVGTKWVKIGDSMIASGGLTNAAISSSAAIDQTKLAFTAWATYTPTWGSQNNPQPSLGNGTITGRYAQLGKTVVVRINLTVGSTSGTGTGYWTFSLPANAHATLGASGNAYAEDSGVNSYQLLPRMLGATAVILYTTASPAVVVTGTAPFTWGNADFFQLGMTYEAA